MTEPEFKFISWVDGKKYALFLAYDRIKILVPRSRLIPHIACEVEARAKGINDVNKIVEYCTEKNSLYGLALFRYFLDKLEDIDYDIEKAIKKGLLEKDERKAFYFRRSCNLAKVRELIAEGIPTDEALRKAKCI